MTHARHAAATIHLLGASQVSKCRVFPLATSVAFIAQLCDARAERARRLKPFVACCDLIIVIPLYAWERIRVMTINQRQLIETRMCSSRVTPAPFPADGSKNGEGCADDST
jgi:hypothetical protein